MMKMALFGATGQVGSMLLKKLLDNHHEVNVLVRDPARLQSFGANLQVFKGDVLNKIAVEKCVRGTSVVFVLLGTYGNKPTNVYSQGTRNIIDAMEAQQCKRIICLSSAGVLGYDGGFVFGRIIIPLFLSHPFRDKRKQLEIIRCTNLDWTIIRPTEIKPEKKRGQLAVTDDKPKKMSISMDTLVDYLYNEIYNLDNIKRMPIIGD